MAADVLLKGMPPYGYSAPVVVLSRLNDAQRSPMQAKDVSPAVMWFSGIIPFHESAVAALKDSRITSLRVAVLKENRDLGLDESDVNINEVRRFINSDVARKIGLPDLVTALEFNAKLADRTVAVPALFQKDKVPTEKGVARFLAGSHWWKIGIMGISERHSVTLPVSFNADNLSYVRAVESIARTAEKYSSDITIRNSKEGSHAISAKSIFGVIAVGIEPGNQITIEAEGPDSKKAISAMVRRIHAIEKLNAKAVKPK